MWNSTKLKISQSAQKRAKKCYSKAKREEIKTKPTNQPTNQFKIKQQQKSIIGKKRHIQFV